MCPQLAQQVGELVPDGKPSEELLSVNPPQRRGRHYALGARCFGQGQVVQALGERRECDWVGQVLCGVGLLAGVEHLLQKGKNRLLVSRVRAGE